jgi:hypothetical protein
MATKRPFPRVRDRLWGRAQFRRGWRRYQKKDAFIERLRGRGLFRRIRSFLRRLFYVFH